MCDETKPNIEFALKAFKKMCLKDELIFTVDKDFGQLAVLRAVFPRASVLLCIFHAIKFMKVLFASAPVLIEKKDAMLSQFRKILYSNSEEEFKAEESEFLKVCKGVTVKTRDKQSPLDDYYIRNWRSCKEMWVKVYRKPLPRCGDNTSNRVERFFWTLKKSIHDTFLSLPPTVMAAVHLIKFADQRLEEKYAFATNKSTVIYDANENIRDLNTEASMILNDRGCTMFHIAQKRLEKRRDKLEKADGGVVETFDSEKRLYHTTESTCNCTFSINHQAPCSHILFIRESDGFPEGLFSKDLFHKRYQRVFNVLDSLLDDPSTEVEQGAEGVENHDTGEVYDDEVMEEAETVLNDKQKYRLVTPIVLRIGNLIACHPTKKFLQYLDALNELEKRIRKGQNFTLQMHRILADIDESDNDEPEETEENEEETEENVEETEDDVEEDEEREEETNDTAFAVTEADESEHDDAVPLVEVGDMNDNIVINSNDSQETLKQDESSQDEIESLSVPGSSSNKFNFLFKQSLKTKGRPKKKSKQFSFNKTAVDRKNALPKKAKVKKQASKKATHKDYFIDDSESSDDEEDDLAFEPDDDSDDDMTKASLDSEVSFQCSICGKSISPLYRPPSCPCCKTIFHENCEVDYGCPKCSIQHEFNNF